MIFFHSDLQCVGRSHRLNKYFLSTYCALSPENPLEDDMKLDTGVEAGNKPSSHLDQGYCKWKMNKRKA